jgi:ribosome-binding ATPase YchF (GTP1/OBG family)
MLIGLVGKPSAGKSTFFKAATLAEVAIASYPFTTIKSNHGIGYVKVDCVEEEFGVKCRPNHGFCVKGKRFVPVEIMDVAGLVPGASEGKGLGNKFLDDLRAADVFVHILDVSGTTDAEGKPLTNSDYDVSKDVEFLEQELDKWFFNIMVKAWKTFIRKIETEFGDISNKGNFSKTVAKQFSGLKVSEAHVRNVLVKTSFPARPGLWNNDNLMKFASALRKESKPVIIAANKIDLEKSPGNYEKIKEKFPGMVVIPCSADSELALREASKAGLVDYVPGERKFEILGSRKINEEQASALKRIKKNVLDRFETGTGVQAVLNYAVFDLLKYIAVFPVENVHKLTDSRGNILPDCFLLPEGSTALDFAYFMHTDLGNNFVKAIDARSKTALGKDHRLKHRDSLEIVTR